MEPIGVDGGLHSVLATNAARDGTPEYRYVTKVTFDCLAMRGVNTRHTLAEPRIRCLSVSLGGTSVPWPS